MGLFNMGLEPCESVVNREGRDRDTYLPTRGVSLYYRFRDRSDNRELYYLFIL